MKYFVLFIFLSSTTLFSQKNSGQIIYSLKFIKSLEDIQRDAKHKQVKENLEKAASELRFELIFNQNESLFFLVKDLAIDENDFNVGLAKSIFGGDKMFYTDISNRYYSEQKNFFGKLFLIKKSLNDNNWILTNESKNISGYICYKAIGSRESIGSNFEVSKIETYAWYCPEIPVNFGPFEAVGLPGLVLEYRLKGHSFIVEKIDFDKKILIKKPENGEFISQKDFDVMIIKKAEQETRN